MWGARHSGNWWLVDQDRAERREALEERVGLDEARRLERRGIEEMMGWEEGTLGRREGGRGRGQNRDRQGHQLFVQNTGQGTGLLGQATRDIKVAHVVP